MSNGDMFGKGRYICMGLSRARRDIDLEFSEGRGELVIELSTVVVAVVLVLVVLICLSIVFQHSREEARKALLDAGL